MITRKSVELSDQLTVRLVSFWSLTKRWFPYYIFIFIFFHIVYSKYLYFCIIEYRVLNINKLL